MCYSRTCMCSLRRAHTIYNTIQYTHAHTRARARTHLQQRRRRWRRLYKCYAWCTVSAPVRAHANEWLLAAAAAALWEPLRTRVVRPRRSKGPCHPSVVGKQLAPRTFFPSAANDSARSATDARCSAAQCGVVYPCLQLITIITFSYIIRNRVHFNIFLLLTNVSHVRTTCIRFLSSAQ